MIIPIVILTFFFSFCFLAIVKQNDDIKELKKDVKVMKGNIDQLNVTVVRLMYHKSIEIEDYETVANIKKKMPKDFDFYKF